MKSLSILMVAMMLIGMTGCQLVTNPNGQTDWNTVVQNNRPAIQATAQIATAAALLNVKEADRVPTARFMYEVALSVDTSLSSGTVDPTAVNKLVQNLLSQWNNPNAIIVGSLINTIESFAQSYVNNSFSQFTTDQKNQALVAILITAAKGVEQSTLPYVQGVPVAPSIRPVGAAKNVIVVVPMTWTQSQ